MLSRFTVQTNDLLPLLDSDVLAAIEQLAAATMSDQFAVACSGGVDSAMLGVHAVVWARLQGKTLHFFHVHHGLQQHAHGWMQQVHQLAALLEVPCHTQRVHVDLTVGDGLESAARTARYQAFKKMAELTGVDAIFLGHHLDDQAETVLLRLLRGAGVMGMGAMATSAQRDGLLYLRPLLETPRRTLIETSTRFAALMSWKPVWDPTNLQDDYTRGALRDRIVPHLNERWVGWQKVLARHAKHNQETQELLDELAESDLQNLDMHQDDYSFDLAKWRLLSVARQQLVLRYWLALQQQAMPTKGRLSDMLRQMRELHALGFDRQMRIKHGSAFLCCVRGRVFLHFDTSASEANKI